MQNKQQEHLPSQFLHLKGCFHPQKIMTVCNKVDLHLQMSQKIPYQSPKLSVKHKLASVTSSAAPF